MTKYPRWWQGHDGLGAQGLGTLTTAPARGLPPTCPQGHAIAEVGGYRDVGPRPRLRCPSCEAATEARRAAAQRERYRAWSAARRRADPQPHACPQGHVVDGDNLLLVGRRGVRRCRQCWEARAAATAERRAAQRAARERQRAGLPHRAPARPPRNPIAPDARQLPGVGQWGLPVLRYIPGRVLHWHLVVGWQAGLEGIAWMSACRVVILRRGRTSLDPSPPTEQRCTVCVRRLGQTGAGLHRPNEAGPGPAGTGEVRPGADGPGPARHGALRGESTGGGGARDGMGWLGPSGPGEAWRALARRAKDWTGRARRGKRRQVAARQG